ncbi:helix-turn-helix domain-containing protein [Embleya scabrispora]|uniref:helix-turn-helix domain-containing protein n=1 Tax=Embleya scabrispora TaxID=159449 RepID=UPI00036EC657|nr:helix-turn-helix transcriptional regulator [Embleya scabrispora]MYS83256.1 helix-turn-helix domain-containing protein [Streptomyces sp. SID5474]
MPTRDPMFQGRRLRAFLRQTREACGFIQRDVAVEMDWSLSKLIRIETGQVNISTTDLKALLQHYGVVEPARVAEYIDMARASKQRSWWYQYRNHISNEFKVLLGYESSATVIRNFEPLLVPGLLQTEEYAREVLRIMAPPETPGQEDLVALRMERQERLIRPDGPALHFIVDESVMHRTVGNAAIMRNQIRRMRDFGEWPNITLRVIPFTAGLYSRARIAYQLLEFPEIEDEAVLFIENPSGDMIIREGNQEDPPAVSPLSYLETFWGIEQLASRDLAPALLDSALERFGPGSGHPLPGADTGE